MDIFEQLENLNVSDECFNDIISIVEELISETSDERAHRASVESHDRYWTARNAHDSLDKTIKSNKKTGFFNADEIKELKDELKRRKKELKKAERISVRDNRNQFNRDKRLGRTPTNEALSILEELISVLEKYRPECTLGTPEDREAMKLNKSLRRNAQRCIKQHDYNAKELDKKATKAAEEGKERRAEYLSDKANAEWDKSTRQEDRALIAQNEVDRLREKRWEDQK